MTARAIVRGAINRVLDSALATLTVAVCGGELVRLCARAAHVDPLWLALSIVGACWAIRRWANGSDL